MTTDRKPLSRERIEALIELNKHLRPLHSSDPTYPETIAALSDYLALREKVRELGKKRDEDSHFYWADHNEISEAIDVLLTEVK